MEFASLDGNMLLADQESAIRFVEAKGFEMLNIKKSIDGSITNIVMFRKLPIGMVLTKICFSLTAGHLPDWRGDIYVDGQVVCVEAKR